MTTRPERIVIKIGTKAVSTGDGCVDLAVLSSTVDQIVALQEMGHTNLLVSSGAVGSGRSILGRQGSARDEESIADKQLYAAVGQPKLHGMYDALFASHGYHAAQTLIQRSDFGTDLRDIRGTKNLGILFKWVASEIFRWPELLPNPNLVNSFERAFGERKVIPVCNENDTTAIDELRFSDNDDLASRVARLIGATRFIKLSHLDGVYSKDPSRYGDARLLRHIDFARSDTLPLETNGRSVEGRGGMDTTMEMARRLTRLNIPVHVVSSREPDALLRIMGGEEIGTLFTNNDAKSYEKGLFTPEGFIPPRRPEGGEFRDHTAAETSEGDGTFRPQGLTQIFSRRRAP